MLADFIRSSNQTQTIWAARLGISRSYLSLLVGGAKSPSLDLAALIERETGGAVRMQCWASHILEPAANEEGAIR